MTPKGVFQKNLFLAKIGQSGQTFQKLRFFRRTIYFKVHTKVTHYAIAQYARMEYAEERESLWCVRTNLHLV